MQGRKLTIRLAEISRYDKTAWQKVMPFYHIRALVCLVLSIKRDRLNANPPLQQYDRFRQPQ